MPSAKCQFCALNTFRENVWTNKQTNKQTNKLENPLVKGTAAGVISEEFITKTLKTIIFSAPNTTDPKLLIIASNYIRSNS